ncbi:MAG TPA: hypothetical protein VLT36_11680 [Candidatus Dormibacteraeota bacterium]|nr:hypothetical protein [Candidatus Dormibacteraeota bacterium]
MSDPLALVMYEKLLPGSQIVNKLTDLKFRVQSLDDPSRLVETAEQSKPLLILADTESSRHDVPAAIGKLKQNAGTSHIPIIVFTRDNQPMAENEIPGAALVVGDAAILNHLKQVIDQALEVE